MSKLCISKFPVGWKAVSDTGNEIVLAFAGRDSSIYAKVRLVDYAGNAEEVEKEMQRKAAALDAVDSEHGSFLFHHIKWNADYYVCDGSDRFRAFFYAVLDGCYLIFEMVTESTVMRTIFCSEVKRLILSVDYSMIVHDNRFEVNSKVFRLETPQSFRFSALSTEDRLFFWAETKYLVVNVGKDIGSLADYVEGLISNNYLGGMNSNIKIDRVGKGTGSGTCWVRYRVESQEECIGMGTYFVNEVQGERIISYLFEHGSGETDVSTLLKFRGG